MKKTKKGKKALEESKPEFDLNAVLPKVDDFRTSLIMPGLSTRFSMLREQDDPDSKLGKASDDSVLQPKRQSRLHEFGFVPGGLSDIAEVSSLNGSIRPPFASERTGSFDSTREEDGSGSVMNRARPGEGNVLFGGRQKIYVISNNSTKGLGRTLYDDDVNMSAFQRLRAEEKERLRREVDEQDGQSSEPSSPSASSRKRETSSSTNSGPLNIRTSTAATSIASQGANSVSVASPAISPSTHSSPAADFGRSGTKSRRLYDQGLDQHIQEQQSSAMNRLNSIQRARAPTGRSTPPGPLSQARSATNLNDRFNRGPTFRSDSPNALAYSSMSRNNSSAGSSPVIPRPLSPPLSPVSDTTEEVHALNAALQPNDRGKATAMGAFNKPKEAFSEEQYAERLRHMRQERETQVGGAKVDKSPPRKPSLRERAEKERRKRAESDASRQRSGSPAAPAVPTAPVNASSAFSRFQAAANQMKSPGPATPMSPPKSADLSSHGTQPSESRTVGTFLNSRDSSDAEEETTKPLSHRRFENLPVATGPAPSIFEHPALRSRAPSDAKDPEPAVTGPGFEGGGVDSPTLGPDSGLSGMIRQHLRNVSNVSSNYGEPGPPVMSPPANTTGNLAIQTQDFGFQGRHPGSESVTPAPSTYSHSNPWDLEDIENPYRDEHVSTNSVSPLDGQKASPLVLSATESNQTPPWDLTPRRNHERIASNETEAEHEAFQRDLAQRQRLIQENLRARAEGRSTSPAPGPSGGLKTALNMLRAKSSRESFATIEPSSKSLKKLTLGSNSANVSSTSLAGMHEMPPLRAKPSRVLQQSEQDFQREMGNRQRSGTDGSRVGRPGGRSPPVSSRSSTRDRSGSGTSRGRSQSRPGRSRDDFEQATMEGTRSVHPANATPPLSAEMQSLESQTRLRARSNSRTAASNYFESKHLQPIQTNATSSSASPRLPHTKFSPGIPISPRPSPGGMNHQPNSPMPPFSANHTPPVSNPTTPNAAAFNPSMVQPIIRQGVLRKKSIAKSEISEPIFLSTTSTIDLVNLPPGASLKNGQEPDAPPVPPINPMRRRFGLGRAEPQQNPYDPAVQPGFDSPRTPFAEPVRTNSADALPNEIPQPRNRLRKTSSEGRSLRATAQVPSGPSPAVPQGGFVARNDSPPRSRNDQPKSQQRMEGAMF